MPRITPVYRPADYPGDPVEIAELFAGMFPGKADPAMAVDHAGMAVAAHNPKLAQQLSAVSRFIALDLGFSQRADLRELAIQTVHRHFGSDFSFRSRIAGGKAAGLTEAMLAALPDWTSPLFDEEQKLVIEYAAAVAASRVTDDLSARVVARYGELGAVELTTITAYWGFWAMFLDATGPDFE